MQRKEYWKLRGQASLSSLPDSFLQKILPFNIRRIQNEEKTKNSSVCWRLLLWWCLCFLQTPLLPEHLAKTYFKLDIIRNVYNIIAGISAVLAGLMSAVTVIGAKISNNQHKVNQSLDWLKRICIAWAVVNGIGAFIKAVILLFKDCNVPALTGTAYPEKR